MTIKQTSDGQWEVTRHDGSLFAGPFGTRKEAISYIREYRFPEPIIEHLPEIGWVTRLDGDVIAGPFDVRPIDDLSETDTSKIRETAIERANAFVRSGHASEPTEVLGFYAVLFMACRKRLPPLSLEGDRQMRCHAMREFDDHVETCLGRAVMPWRLVDEFSNIFDEFGLND